MHAHYKSGSLLHKSPSGPNQRQKCWHPVFQSSQIWTPCFQIMAKIMQPLHIHFAGFFSEDGYSICRFLWQKNVGEYNCFTFVGENSAWRFQLAFISSTLKPPEIAPNSVRKRHTHTLSIEWYQICEQLVAPSHFFSEFSKWNLWNQFCNRIYHGRKAWFWRQIMVKLPWYWDFRRMFFKKFLSIYHSLVL